MKEHAASSSFYFLGFLGAVVYFIQNATSFWEGLLGILKAFFWPGIIIYRVFQYLG